LQRRCCERDIQTEKARCSIQGQRMMGGTKSYKHKQSKTATHRGDEGFRKLLRSMYARRYEDHTPLPPLVHEYLRSPNAKVSRAVVFDRFASLVRSFPKNTAHPDYIKLDELLSDVHEFKKRGAPRLVTLERMDSFKATNKGFSKAGIRTNATNFLRRVKPNVSDRQVYYFLKEVCRGGRPALSWGSKWSIWSPSALLGLHFLRHGNASSSSAVSHSLHIGVVGLAPWQHFGSMRCSAFSVSKFAFGTPPRERVIFSHTLLHVHV
jgi:hypothetical protein